MKTDKMMEKSGVKQAEHFGQNITKEQVQQFSVKTPFQKNQVSIPFQGYNYFGSKPKFDE
jgi:hypothetical protein